MNLKRQRTLHTEIYKTLNKWNPGYMNELQADKYMLNL